uniref:Uncharacterized protein n=1 Tax=Lepeophtheirus salmonis TaxID=72036 RepID=A0A0K2U992_LEPSM
MNRSSTKILLMGLTLILIINSIDSFVILGSWDENLYKNWLQSNIDNGNGEDMLEEHGQIIQNPTEILSLNDERPNIFSNTFPIKHDDKFGISKSSLIRLMKRRSEMILNRKQAN